MKLVQIGAVVVVLAAIAALSGVGRPEAANGSAPNARSVTVSGSGDVEAVPDRAGLSVGVSSDASTAGAALAANAAKAARVLERSEEHTSELQSRSDLVCRLLLEKK